MTDGEGMLLLVFDSIHDVVRAERLLLAAGIPCDLLPTPHDVSSDCGMVVACDAAHEEAVRDLAAGGRLAWRNLVRRDAAGRR